MQCVNFGEFVLRANEIHGNRFKYFEDSYRNTNSSVLIECSLHGQFHMRASSHLNGQSCRKCSIASRLSRSLQNRSLDFIKKSKNLHGDGTYSYSDIEYVNNRIPVKIYCTKHGGYFKQAPQDHVAGHGCSVCAGNSRSNTINFINKAIVIHGDAYTYDKVEYVSSNKKVTVTCTLHGDWKVKPNDILNGYGCPKCWIDAHSKSLKYDNEIFITKAKKIHSDSYDYSEVQYIDSRTKVKIKCNKHSRIFNQTPANHLRGVGCPMCCESKGEREIAQWLMKNKIKFESQYKFQDCRSKYPLPFDFVIFGDNVVKCIEFQGGQHYHPVNRFGGIKSFESLIVRDAIKRQYCEYARMKLLIVKYDEIGRLDAILRDFLVDRRIDS